jgi:hypothetical protein
VDGGRGGEAEAEVVGARKVRGDDLGVGEDPSAAPRISRCWSLRMRLVRPKCSP